MIVRGWRRTWVRWVAIIGAILIAGWAFLRSMTLFLLMIQLIGMMPHSEPSGVNILVVGIDNVEGTHRSDTMAVLHLNQHQSTVRALSIPRDTRVTIPGVGVSKMNHAYAHGGIDLLKTTVSEFLSIPIHSYLTVNSQGLIRMIDAIGGIQVTIPNDMKYNDYAGNLHINFSKGRNQLTGDELLKYLRFRNDKRGDIGRIDRQQAVVRGLLDELFNLKTLMVSPNLIRLFMGAVESDISLLNATKWMKFFMDDDREVEFQFYVIPGSVRIIDGISYWRPNILYMDNLITKTFVDYAVMPESESSNGMTRIADHRIKRVTQQMTLDNTQDIHSFPQISIEILNGNGQPGLATKTAKAIQGDAMTVTRVGNSESFGYRDTIIVDWKGNIERSMMVASMLSIDPSNIVVYDREDKPLDITIVLGENWSPQRIKDIKNDK